MRHHQRPSTTRRGAIAATVVAIAFAGVPVSGVASADATGGDPTFSWELLDSGTDDIELLGLDLVSSEVAWVGSWGPELLRTVDGGTTFTNVAPADAVELGMELSEVEALSVDTALAIAYLPDAPDRLYRTADGGVTWTETYRSEDASFYNCLAMFDRRRGFVLGDPVDGEFEVLVTSDGGRSWTRVPGDALPDPIEGEAGATFGGECAAATRTKGFFGTGFAAESRVFRSDDYGLTWEVSPTGTGDLINALEFRTNRLGVETGVGLMRTTDGGLSWEPADASPGFRSDVAWWLDYHGDQRTPIPDAQKIVFAIGPDGTDVSRDRGKTFERFDDGAFYSIDCLKGTTTCWAAGPEGRIARLVVS